MLKKIIYLKKIANYIYSHLCYHQIKKNLLIQIWITILIAKFINIQTSPFYQKDHLKEKNGVNLKFYMEQ